MTSEHPAEAAVIEGYDALLSDLDGVVYEGGHSLPDAVEALTRAQDDGVALGFVTNNASRTPAEVAEQITGHGLPADGTQVFGSALAAAELIARDAQERGLSHASVMVVGSPALREAVIQHGLVPVPATAADAADAPSYVVQGFSREIGWEQLAAASYAVQAGATWVATNTDLTLPQPEGMAPGNGTLVGAVGAATGQSPRVAGKPEPALMRIAAERLGAPRPLVLGDRMDTDIAGGAAAGFDTALILTGVHSLADARRLVESGEAPAPTYVLETLADLFRDAENRRWENVA